MPTAKIYRNPSYNNDETLMNTKNKLNDEASNKKNVMIDNTLLSRGGLKKKKKKKLKLMLNLPLLRLK